MHIFTLLYATASRAMKTKMQFCASSLFIFFFLLFAHFSEAKDLYQTLGVDKSASQREIQKAFHRLSLKYHPDKNPSKSAQAKFAEINNAYETLSDEEKRKNYDLFGDEQGKARGPEPHSYGGNSQRRNEDNRWSTFESSNNNNGYRFEQHSYAFGGDDSSSQGDFFSFPTGNSYGGHDRSFSFGFGGPFQDMFHSLFGSMGGKQGERKHFSNDGDTGKTKSNSRSLTEELTSKTFQKKVLDELETWAILFVPLFSNEAKQKLQLLEQIADTMKGCIKVGYVDCEKQQRLCEEQNMVPLKTIKLRFYSLRNNGKLAALEYTGEWSSTALKRYCIDVLPRFSEHLDHVSLLEETFEEDKGPIAVLFTKKKGTPAMWRALSGLFYGRMFFLDVQITDDDVKFAIQKFHISKFPAILGVSLNGETQVLSSGKELEQISSSIEHLKALLEDFEKKSKSAGPKKEKSPGDGEVPSLSKMNFKSVCGQDTTLCVIGIHRSSRGRDKLKQIFKEISQKTLIRKGQRAAFSKKPVFYAVVDATKQPTFLRSFGSSVSESENTVLIAYKPKKGTYTYYDGPLNLESAESFVIEILVGDLQLKRVLQDPVLV